MTISFPAWVRRTRGQSRRDMIRSKRWERPVKIGATSPDDVVLQEAAGAAEECQVPHLSTCDSRAHNEPISPELRSLQRRVQASQAGSPTMQVVPVELDESLPSPWTTLDSTPQREILSEAISFSFGFFLSMG